MGIQLMAAFGKVNITPEEPAPLQGYDPLLHIADPDKDILDPLHARIMLLDDGITRMVFVNVDSCLTNENLVKVCAPNNPINEYREFVISFPTGTRDSWALAAGVEGDCISVHATHTHSAPAHFSEKYTARIEEEIRNLLHKMVPVKVSISSGTSGISANRRPALSPNFNIPIDHSLQILWFETLEDQPIGSMISYAVHPTCLKNPSNRVSSEFVGLAMSKLEASTGKGFVSLFLQGFSGDVCPLYGGRKSTGDTYPQVLEGGQQLYQDIQSTITTRCLIEDAPLTSALRVIELPTREGFYKPYMTVTLMAKRIGEVAILSVSAELFNGFVDKIKAHSPFTYTLFSGVANGYSGYIPTKEAFADGLGGYELNTTPYTIEAESIIVKESAVLLQELAEKN